MMLSQIWSYRYNYHCRIITNADRRHLPAVIFKRYSHLVDRAADQKSSIGAATYGIIDRLTFGMSHLISNPLVRSGLPLVA